MLKELAEVNGLMGNLKYVNNVQMKWIKHLNLGKVKVLPPICGLHTTNKQSCQCVWVKKKKKALELTNFFLDISKAIN